MFALRPADDMYYQLEDGAAAEDPKPSDDVYYEIGSDASHDVGGPPVYSDAMSADYAVIGKRSSSAASSRARVVQRSVWSHGSGSPSSFEIDWEIGRASCRERV